MGDVKYIVGAFPPSGDSFRTVCDIMDLAEQLDTDFNHYSGERQREIAEQFMRELDDEIALQILSGTNDRPRLVPVFAYVMSKDGFSGIIGCGFLYITRQISGAYGRLEGIMVDHDYRGRRIGQRLTNILIERARDLGLDHIDLTSNPLRKVANRLYKKLGFKRYETNVYRLKLK